MSGSGSASIIDLYDSLLAAEDERSRARIIANAFEKLKDRYPEIKDLATASGLQETELCLQKEIEQVRLRIEEVCSDLTKEIALANQKVPRWTTGLYVRLISSYSCGSHQHVSYVNKFRADPTDHRLNCETDIPNRP